MMKKMLALLLFAALIFTAGCAGTGKDAAEVYLGDDVFIAGLNDKVTALENEKTKLAGEIEALGDESVRLNEEIEALKSETELLSGKIVELEENILNNGPTVSEPETNIKSGTPVKVETTEKNDHVKNTQPDGVEVVFTDKINIPKDIYNSRYSDRIEFDIEITNTTGKDIKGIQGSVEVQDLFGVKIDSFNCDLTQKTIATGTTTFITGLGFDINQFIDSEVKLYVTDFDNLIFVYTVKQIIYTDGTTEKY